ncbi:MAG: LSU ribosomal protein L22p (L17e), partial [uncultured Solirubrobacteraceae bacterium]
ERPGPQGARGGRARARAAGGDLLDRDARRGRRRRGRAGRPGRRHGHRQHGGGRAARCRPGRDPGRSGAHRGGLGRHGGRHDGGRAAGRVGQARRPGRLVPRAPEPPGAPPRRRGPRRRRQRRARRPRPGQVRAHVGPQGPPRLRPHPRQVRGGGPRDPGHDPALGRRGLAEAARVRGGQRRAQPRAGGRRAEGARRLRRRGPDPQAVPPARHGAGDPHPQADQPPDDPADAQGAL